MTDTEPANRTTASTPNPSADRVPTPGGYSSLLNPFVYFHSLLDLGDCDGQRRAARPSSKRT